MRILTRAHFFSLFHFPRFVCFVLHFVQRFFFLLFSSLVRFCSFLGFFSFYFSLLYSIFSVRMWYLEFHREEYRVNARYCWCAVCVRYVWVVCVCVRKLLNGKMKKKNQIPTEIHFLMCQNSFIEIHNFQFVLVVLVPMNHTPPLHLHQFQFSSHFPHPCR